MSYDSVYKKNPQLFKNKPNKLLIKIARKLENKTGLKISTFPKKSLSQNEGLELFKLIGFPIKE